MVCGGKRKGNERKRRCIQGPQLPGIKGFGLAEGVDLGTGSSYFLCLCPIVCGLLRCQVANLCTSHVEEPIRERCGSERHYMGVYVGCARGTNVLRSRSLKL